MPYSCGFDRIGGADMLRYPVSGGVPTEERAEVITCGARGRAGETEPSRPRIPPITGCSRDPSSWKGGGRTSTWPR